MNLSINMIDINSNSVPLTLINLFFLLIFYIFYCSSWSFLHT